MAIPRWIASLLENATPLNSLGLNFVPFSEFFEPVL
jgi:hypothetical protein